jgi:hypothetical protein
MPRRATYIIVDAENADTTGVRVVASDAFATEGVPREAVRVCLGGTADRFAASSAPECMHIR